MVRSASPTQVASPPQTIDARPVAVNLLLYQGDDFYLDLVVTQPDGTPADLTGMTPRAEIRKTAEDVVVLAAFTATVAGNVVSLHLAHTASTDLTAGVWDCQVTDGTDGVWTLAAGTVETDAEVTR